MNKKQIQSLANRFKFERYGRVNLPFGLHTQGIDRTPTRNLIFTESLKGKSVLDVGCAYGYLCFEAEDLGASRVVGMETKPARLKRAEIFKQARNSNVEFINESIVDYEFKEKFDYVIILNVIHHLKDHGQNVLEKLINNTKEKFIIESPYLEHFRASPEDAVRRLVSNIEVHPSPLSGPERGNRQIVVANLHTSRAL